MKPTELKEVLSKIAQNLSNQALATELLTKVGETYETTYTQNETLLTAQKDFTEQIESLQKTNMNLFLKVSNPSPIAPETINQDKKLTYDDVLKDLGGIK